MTPVLGNIALEFFLKGGPIMWPILLCLLAALTVIVERALWWNACGRKAEKTAMVETCRHIASGRFAEALALCQNRDDPCFTILREGLQNANGSMTGAMLMRASEFLEHAEKRQWLLGSFITMAPLLGLLGTVSGIMRSFSFVGEETLAVTKVSGGIAEALIATACGLAVAIICLLPYNYFNRRLGVMRYRLERTINHAELLLESARRRGCDIENAAAHFAEGADATQAADADGEDCAPAGKLQTAGR